MATPKVRIDVNANAVGFFRTMSGVKGELSSVVGLSNGLKTALVGALGGGTLVGIVNHMMDFAKSLEDVSKNLDVSIERAYELKKAALEAGKSLDDFERPKRSIFTFMQQLAGGKHAGIAAELGLTGTENWNQALIKALTAARGHGRGWTPFTTFAGKGAEWMLNPTTRESLIKGGAGGFDTSAVHEMARFKLEMELLALQIEKELLPAFADLANFLYKKIINPNMDEATARAIAHKAAAESIGAPIGTLHSMYRASNRASFSSDKEYEKYIKSLYGEKGNIKYWDTYYRNVGELRTKTENMEKTAAERRADFEAEQKAIENAPGDWTAPERKRMEFGSNPFLKIGGLMGIDTTLRLQQQTVNLLAQIEVNTRGEKAPSQPHQSIFPVAQPAPPPVAGSRINRGGQTYESSGTPALSYQWKRT